MSSIVCKPAETAAELEECFRIRREVFVIEQGLFSESDRDEHDDRAIHIIAQQRDRIVGTVRVYEEKKGVFRGGRLAVIRRYRGKAGRFLVLEAVKMVRQRNAHTFRALIQKKNVSFFKSLGWNPVGSETIQHGKPHIFMEAPL